MDVTNSVEVKTENFSCCGSNQLRDSAVSDDENSTVTEEDSNGSLDNPEEAKISEENSGETQFPIEEFELNNYSQSSNSGMLAQTQTQTSLYNGHSNSHTVAKKGSVFSGSMVENSSPPIPGSGIPSSQSLSHHHHQYSATYPNFEIPSAYGTHNLHPAHHHGYHSYLNPFHNNQGAIYPGSAGAGSVEGSSTTVPQSSNFESSVTQSLSHHYQAPFSYTNNYHHHPHLPRHHPYSGYGKHHEMGSWAQGLLAQAAYGNGSRLAPTATSTTGQQYSDRQSVSPTYQGTANTNSSTRTSTNNSSNSTNHGSPSNPDQQQHYPSNNQSSVGSSGHGADHVNSDQQPVTDDNFSPPLKSTLSSDMLVAQPHTPGNQQFGTFCNLTNGHQMPQNAVAKKGKSGRGRGRRPPNPSPSPEQSLERVFIWDLDETLIIHNTLLADTSGVFYYKGGDERQRYNLGNRMEEIINWFGDTHFFYTELDDSLDQTHIDDVANDDDGRDLSDYDFREDRFSDGQSRHLSHMNTIARGGVDWMRKLAYRYRKIKELYNEKRHWSTEELLGADKHHERVILDQINDITGNWLAHGKRCVQITSDREKCANILVTQSPLVPTICKVLLYGLGPYFEVENIYAAHKVGKDNIFQKLMNKYGKKCTYVVIGDGADEESAAHRLNMPFWKVSSPPDLLNLQRALVDFHM